MSNIAPSNGPGRLARNLALQNHRGRAWLFRGLSVLLGLVVVAAFELALRLAGVGSDLRLTIPVARSSTPGRFRLNDQADRPYFGPRDLGGPEPRHFALPKPPGTQRLVVVGASTVNGFPFAAELAFPRQLELLLQKQAPELCVEVLNAGITAINSSSVADVVRQAIGLQPDLIIVHTGHNEFFGPSGVGSSVWGVGPTFYPTMTTIKRTRTYQLFARWLLPAPKSNQHLIATLPGNQEITFESPLFRLAVQRYRENLCRIRALCTRARIPVLLTSVACNLRDQSPIRTLWPPALSTKDRQLIEESLRQGEECLARAQFDLALAELDRGLQRSPTNALLCYRKAECLEQSQRFEEAAEFYRRARDYDGCRFRAPGVFRDVVRQIAKTGDQQGVFYLDLAGELEHHLDGRVPGNDLFLEHVHYTIDGHWQLALALARFIRVKVLRSAWSTEQVPSTAERDRLLGLTVQDRLAAASFALLAISQVPLSEAPDSSRQEEFLAMTIRTELAALPTVEQQAFADLDTASMQQELLEGLAARHLQAGRTEQAVKLLRVACQRRPWSTKAHWLLARSSLLCGDREQAVASAKQLILLDPGNVETRALLERLGPMDAASPRVDGTGSRGRPQGQ